MIINRKVLLPVLVVLAVTLAAISASALALNAINTASQSATTSGTNDYHSNWMSENQQNMMNNMMGGNWGPSSTSTPVATTAQSSILPLIGLITLVGAALTGTGGAAYYYVGRPKNILYQPTLSTITNPAISNVETPYDSVSKTLTADERKVVNVLTSNNGEYLQKYIRSETGLSRLKIHRIITRLAERGIVTLEQSGNTNKVHLSSWLSKQPFSKINPQENIKQEMVNNT
jgi:uncharacterized membrane protein